MNTSFLDYINFLLLKTKLTLYPVLQLLRILLSTSIYAHYIMIQFMYDYIT